MSRACLGKFCVSIGKLRNGRSCLACRLRSKYYHARVIEWEGSDEKGGGDDDDFASQSTEAHCIGKKHLEDEPIIGFAAVLPDDKFAVVRECTDDW